jgi:transposase InsO family protein
VLVELNLVEQRYKAVLEVLDGASVTDVARRNGVSRQTVHAWLRRYANQGLGSLADKSKKPEHCPHQMAPETEAKVLELRRAHAGWGPRTILGRLRDAGVEPLPSRSAIYRALVRHKLIDPQKRKRQRSDYKRWERTRSMELWQMDVMGRYFLSDGTECKVVTGVDDHSRFCVCAKVVARATARPVCDALLEALSTHGAPEQLLSDNGKVFTARFGLGPGPVLFDRICHDNGIKHILTAPYSPTTTGKIERFHRTVRDEFLCDHDRVHATIADAQAALDTWVAEYNSTRNHQSLGDRPPQERFALARSPAGITEVVDVIDDPVEKPVTPRPLGVTRWVNAKGQISIGAFRYRVGATYAGERVDVVVRSSLVEILHQGVLVATHAERRAPGRRPIRSQGPIQGHAHQASTGLVVTRRVDRRGTTSFAGTTYAVGMRFAGQMVQVAIVAHSVQISSGGRVVKVHAIRHDRQKEHGAFARPNGRPGKRVA